MFKKIAIWIRVWKTLWIWIWMIRIVSKEINSFPPEEQLHLNYQIKDWRAAIGTCILTLIGVYPLYDGWDIEPELFEPDLSTEDNRSLEIEKEK